MPDRVALKANRIMVVSDPLGDIFPEHEDHLGVYLDDTRFVSRYQLQIEKKPPVLLSYSAKDAAIATFHLVNASLPPRGGKEAIPRQSMSIRRTRFVSEGLHERVDIENWARTSTGIRCDFSFDADFRDLFGLRTGIETFAVQRETHVAPSEVLFEYCGEDALRRLTRFCFEPQPDFLDDQQAIYDLVLEHGEGASITIDVIPGFNEKRQTKQRHFGQALASLREDHDSWHRSCTRYTVDDRPLNDGLLERSQIDLSALTERLGTGLFPVAGIPFFAVPFGRDSIITSLESMSLNPDLARGTLRYLARHQGEIEDPERAEEPGKILHELRLGELAKLKRIPFSPSFHSIDATPLFLVLLAEVMRWLDDSELFEELLPATKRALQWIDNYGDFDRDGFVEYPQGGHGWKDSSESLLHPDGSDVKFPVALVEVQGYVYRAWLEIANVFEGYGDVTRATELREKAEALRTRFEAAYWLEGEGLYAQALDGDKQPAGGVTSNIGHCLWAGIADATRASAVASRLLAPDMFSGWGVRTLSSLSPNHNPMSYHNGTVWPHDNAIIVAGLRRYGFDSLAVKLISALFEAGLAMPRYQVPELFCGFERDRRFESAPPQYLSANVPQAWSTATTFYLLENAIGIRPDARGKRVEVSPVPIPRVQRIEVAGMRVGSGLVSLAVTYDSMGGASVDVREAPEGFEIKVKTAGGRRAA